MSQALHSSVGGPSSLLKKGQVKASVRGPGDAQRPICNICNSYNTQLDTALHSAPRTAEVTCSVTCYSLTNKLPVSDGTGTHIHNTVTACTGDPLGPCHSLDRCPSSSRKGRHSRQDLSLASPCPSSRAGQPALPSSQLGRGTTGERTGRWVHRWCSWEKLIRCQ